MKTQVILEKQDIKNLQDIRDFLWKIANNYEDEYEKEKDSNLQKAKEMFDKFDKWSFDLKY